MDYIEFTL